MAEEKTLLFAYDALLEPENLFEDAPGANFAFVAHYPEARLDFVIGPKGAIPTLVKDPGHIVWGAVFEISPGDARALVSRAATEGRHRGLRDQKAVDREGNKHDCLVLVAREGTPAQPNPEYVESMVRGARHWNLPAGWIMGLEDLIEDPLLT